MKKKNIKKTKINKNKIYFAQRSLVLVDEYSEAASIIFNCRDNAKEMDVEISLDLGDLSYLCHLIQFEMNNSYIRFRKEVDEGTDEENEVKK